MSLLDSSVTELLATGAAATTAFFLKHLYGKVDKSISKAEFEKSLSDLKVDHDNERKELRENQISIFRKLESQSSVLADLNAKVGLLVSGHIGNHNREQ